MALSPTGKPASEVGSQAIHRALGILHLFTVERPNWSHSEIAAESGLTASTSHRLLKTLQGYELVVVDERKRYSLGPGIIRLAHVIFSSGPVGIIQRAASVHLSHLRDLTGETVGLHVRVGHERVCVAELESRHPIRMASTVGGVLPIYAGAASKAILAFVDSAQREELLAAVEHHALTANTILDPAKLERELTLTRDRGYGMSFGESVDGASALAAPIFDATGRPVACINVTGPADRFDRKQMKEALAALLEATTSISRVLGYSPPGPHSST